MADDTNKKILKLSYTAFPTEESLDQLFNSRLKRDRLVKIKVDALRALGSQIKDVPRIRLPESPHRRIQAMHKLKIFYENAVRAKRHGRLGIKLWDQLAEVSSEDFGARPLLQVSTKKGRRRGSSTRASSAKAASETREGKERREYQVQQLEDRIGALERENTRLKVQLARYEALGWEEEEDDEEDEEEGTYDGL